MKQFFKKSLGSIKRFNLIGVYSSENSLKIVFLNVFFKKDELKIISRDNFESFEDLKNSGVLKSFPIILHIEGDGIINKRKPLGIDAKKEIIFSQNPKDFYFFELYTSEYQFISVSRKKNVDYILEFIKQLNPYILGLSIGPFILSRVIHYLNEDIEIGSAYSSLSTENNQIANIKETPNLSRHYQINNEEYSNAELPLIAAVLNFKFPLKTIEYELPDLKTLISDYTYKSLFKLAVILCLIVSLLTLISSHIILDIYSTEVTQNYLLRSNSLEMGNKYEALKEERKMKEKILLNSGITKKDFLSKYVSEIANLADENIGLIDLTVVPISGKINPGEKIELQKNSIVVSGEVNTDKSFNSFLLGLQEYSWVKKMEIISYLKNSLGKNQFNIKISY